MKLKLSSFARLAGTRLSREAKKLMNSKPAKLSKSFLADHWLFLAATAFAGAGVAMIYLPAGFITVAVLLFVLESKAGS